MKKAAALVGDMGVGRRRVSDGMRVTSKAVPPYWYTCHMFLRRLRIFVPTMYLPLRDILPPYG